MKTDEPRVVSYFHCKSCLSGGLAVGWTIEGLQVYCDNCKLNVIDLDFKGQQVSYYIKEETL